MVARQLPDELVVSNRVDIANIAAEATQKQLAGLHGAQLGIMSTYKDLVGQRRRC